MRHWVEGKAGRRKMRHWVEGKAGRRKMRHWVEGKAGKRKMRHWVEGKAGRRKMRHWVEGKAGKRKMRHWVEGKAGKRKMRHWVEGKAGSAFLALHCSWILNLFRGSIEKKIKSELNSKVWCMCIHTSQVRTLIHSPVYCRCMGEEHRMNAMPYIISIHNVFLCMYSLRMIGCVGPQVSVIFIITPRLVMKSLEPLTDRPT